MACVSASTTSGRRPSLKFGTHSTMAVMMNYGCEYISAMVERFRSCPPSPNVRYRANYRDYQLFTCIVDNQLSFAVLCASNLEKLRTKEIAVYLVVKTDCDFKRSTDFDYLANCRNSLAYFTCDIFDICGTRIERGNDETATFQV